MKQYSSSAYIHILFSTTYAQNLVQTLENNITLTQNINLNKNLWAPLRRLLVTNISKVYQIKV